jgi:acetylornithine deacetylase
MQLSPQEMLARLVAFPSVSHVSNLDIIGFIRDYLASHGVESLIVPSPDGQKANLFATVGPDGPGGVILSGHTDVVPVEGQSWSSDPFTLREADRRLYGRGTCDMKGFDALALALVPEMLKAPLKRPIHIAMSYDEEPGCLGVPFMIAEVAKRGLQPAAVIVGEPSRMKVVTGHKGGTRMRTRVRGLPMHSSRMDIAVSAVMVMGEIIQWHTRMMEEARLGADLTSPFEPPYTTFHCGIVQGGTAVNIAAEHCELISEFRVKPPEPPQPIFERYLAFIRDVVEPPIKAKSQECGVTVELLGMGFGLRPEQDGEAERLARRLTGDNSVNVVAYGTEAAHFQRAGWSTIVCGPGDIAQAHQPDEFIEISELQAGEAFIRKLIVDLSR